MEHKPAYSKAKSMWEVTQEERHAQETESTLKKKAA
jgi:hypothetical protein